MSLTKKVYIVFGIGVLVLYGYAETVGWKLTDSVMAGTWRPVGRSTFHK